MKKLSRRLSLILLSLILMLSLTACGGNKEEAEDLKEDENLVADEAETNEEEEEAEDDGELTEASGKLTAVKPTEDGGADLTFDTDDGELIIKMKDAGELYKLTILQNYDFNYNGKKEIIDFELSEEQDEE